MTNSSDNTIRAIGNSPDVMGREFSSFCGYGRNVPIPIGSRVRIHDCRYGSSRFIKYMVGREAIVLSELRPDALGISYPHVITLRYVEPVSAWTKNDNITTLEPSHLEVLEVGNGTVIPGVSYRLCEKEIMDARFAEFDFRYDGYTNLPTFQAATGLKQDAQHRHSVRQMVRQDKTINPDRLAAYFKRQPDLSIEGTAWFQGPFPERTEYRQNINWGEIAKEFSTIFKEEDSFA